ncbi:hypothetical protein ACP70R_030036 [Stipagrostis hirtigluma subsp. patula]
MAIPNAAAKIDGMQSSPPPLRPLHVAATGSRGTDGTTADPAEDDYKSYFAGPEPELFIENATFQQQLDSAQNMQPLLLDSMVHLGQQEPEHGVHVGSHQNQPVAGLDMQPFPADILGGNQQIQPVPAFDLQPFPPQIPLIKTVYISRRFILQQVMAQLELDVHGSGYEEVAFRLQGWLDLDVPLADGTGGKERMKISADELADTADQAAENAATTALNYMCTFREVEINDFSSDMIKEKDQKIANSKFWEEMFQDHAQKMNKEATAANMRYNTLLADIKKICAAFGDVMPLSILPDGLATQNIVTASFALNSDLNSPARMDQLARALFKLLSGNRVIVPASPGF